MAESFEIVSFKTFPHMETCRPGHISLWTDYLLAIPHSVANVVTNLNTSNLNKINLKDNSIFHFSLKLLYVRKNWIGANILPNRSINSFQNNFRIQSRDARVRLKKFFRICACDNTFCFKACLIFIIDIRDLVFAKFTRTSEARIMW